MNSLDLEVVNVLFFQQMIEAVEEEQWDEAAMALYKLYAIEEGERFSDLTVEPDALNDSLEACLLYTSPSPRDPRLSRMPSSA